MTDTAPWTGSVTKGPEPIAPPCKPSRPAHWNGRISDAFNAAYDAWLDLGQELHLIDQKRAELVERHGAAHREIVRLGRIEGWHA